LGFLIQVFGVSVVLAKFIAWVDRLRRDASGILAVQFALCSVPLLLTAGFMVDYGYALKVKAALDGALDAAARTPVTGAALALTADDATSAGLQAFSGFTTELRRASVRPQISVVDSSGTRTVAASYRAEIATSVVGALGLRMLTVSGSASAQLSGSPYVDMYFLLDNSPSMGLGATTADIATMMANTTDKCAYACHDLSNPNDYYARAKQLGVTMRVDAVRTAAQSLMDTARTISTLQNQYRAAVYSFGPAFETAGLTPLQPLTTDLVAAKAAISTIDLMTVPGGTMNNAPMTPLSAALTSLNTIIPTPGPGSPAAAPQQVLFIVSDAVANEYNPTSCSRPLYPGGRCQQSIPVSLCNAIKARGVRIAALYATYQPSPNFLWYRAWIAAIQNSLGPAMKDCASPGLYLEVSPAQNISDGLAKLFALALPKARLTQ
jgi:Flp pilus assembly protein TadG